MPQFASRPRSSLNNAPLADHAPTNTGADGQIYHVLAPATRPKQVLAQTSRVSIVLDKDRHAEALLEARPQRHLVPPWQIRRRVYHPRAAIQRPRSRNANPRHLPQLNMRL